MKNKYLTKYKQVLKPIYDLREQQGKELKTLNLIDKELKKAKSLPDYDLQVALLLEKHLTYQHLYMNELAKEKNLQNQSVIDQNLSQMKTVTLKAEKIINDHQLDPIEHRIYRFLGRVYSCQNNHQKAKKYYQKAIRLDPRSHHALEYQAFLAEALILTNQPQKGFQTAILLNQNFHQNIGLKLKQADYLTWGIWLSGLWIRIINALIITNNLKPYLKSIKNYLTQIENLLKHPPADADLWTKDPFSYRLQELKSLKKLLV